METASIMVASRIIVYGLVVPRCVGLRWCHSGSQLRVHELPQTIKTMMFFGELGGDEGTKGHGFDWLRLMRLSFPRTLIQLLHMSSMQSDNMLIPVRRTQNAGV
jgi:hypothetical protein